MKGEVGVRSGIKFATWKCVKCYSEMSYYTGNDLEQEEESEGSDVQWDTTNEEGASLDQSLVVLGTGQATTNRARANRDGGQEIAEMAKALTGVLQTQAAGAQVNNDQLGRSLQELTALMAQREKREMEQKAEMDAEKEKKKRERAEGPVIVEDAVKIIEKELKIKDDSNSTIDIQARSILGRNPNAPPSEWWGPDKKWPRVARPAVGALMDVKHLMPSHVAAEAILSYHDREKYLELKHFINKNR